MSRASPLIVFCLVALLTTTVTLLCSADAWAGCASGSGSTGQYLGEESTSDQGDPDELDSTDGRVKIMVKTQPPTGTGGEAPSVSAGPEADLWWQETGELSVLIQLLSVIM